MARAVYEKIRGPKEWFEIPGGHFGLVYYPSPEFDMASSAQVRFLARYLVNEP